MTYEKIAGGITAAGGFQAAGVNAGVKKGSTKKDVALIVSDHPASCAGVFTQNAFAAAPVLYCRDLVKSGQAQAVVVNSGNANAVTGAEGLADAQAMAVATAQALDIAPEQVLVASTGVIGVRLPMDVVRQGIRDAAAQLSPQGGLDAAQAIMTTDTYKKEAAVRFTVSGKTVTVGGMAKGSGMIHPNMATLLCFVTTDAALSPQALARATRAAAEQSFNMITVDGDTSTNDSLLVLANGASGLMIEPESHEYAVFCKALNAVCLELAKLMAADGEGATKLLAIQVEGARSHADAVKIAKAVAGSSLVKTAMFAADANWGRIACAAGYSGAELDVAKVDITLKSQFGAEPVMRAGAGLAFSEENATKVLQAKEIEVVIALHDGEGEATAYGCDLTYDYVKINADYRT